MIRFLDFGVSSESIAAELLLDLLTFFVFLLVALDSEEEDS